ncbi:MAG: hypothetical protein ACMUIE_03715 [Thermoplasmatota archaeon]
MVLMHTVWFGTFILHERSGRWEIVKLSKSPSDPGTIAEDLMSIRQGKLLHREKELRKEFDIDLVTEERLLTLGGASLSELPELKLPGPGEYGFEMTALVEANALLAGMAQAENLGDANILSAVGALTEVDASLNTTVERLREWYSKYWPELSPLIEERDMLRSLAVVWEPSALSSYIKEEYPELFKKMSELDEPRDIGGADLSGVSPLASLALQNWTAREGLETYIEQEMARTAPSLSTVAGPLVGARLIHSAGGIERLVKLPSSTVQVLGAEKMFFKFLKEGGKPPKHGILFQHPWVHSLPSQKRGKMARSLASASSLAARMDLYGGGDPSGMKIKLEKRYQEIRDMETAPRAGGGRQPPFREGWWADKGGDRRGRRRGRRKR